MAGAEGLEVALQPLLRCPKSAGAPVGAADFDRCANPCSLCPPPAAVASVARHAPRAERLSLFTQSKKKKHRLNRCFSFWQGQKDLTECCGFALHPFRSATEILTNFSTRLTLLAKNVPPAHFLNAKTLTGSSPLLLYEK